MESRTVLPPFWSRVLQAVDYAFQPIVDVHTGFCTGFEALLRKHDLAGFDGIGELLDAAWKEGVLYGLDLGLREKALRAFSRFAPTCPTILFFNLDNRIIETPDCSPGNTIRLLEELGLPRERLCFEVSERHRFRSFGLMREVLLHYQRQGFRIAIDDYGSGYAGMELLYYCEPDFIKISRFLIEKLNQDQKKRLLVSHLTRLAHKLGISVVGEGVETEPELVACRELGCDSVQGFFVQEPTRVLDRLRSPYDRVKPWKEDEDAPSRIEWALPSPPDEIPPMAEEMAALEGLAGIRQPALTRRVPGPL